MQAPCCAYCGDALGVYEPIMVLEPDGQLRRTSRLAEGELPADVVAVHEDCLAERDANGAVS